MASRDLGLTVGRLSRALLWLVYAWVVLNLVLLLCAFFLRLLGANPDAGFTEWVYRSVSRSMAPFRGIFEPIPLSDQSVLDTSLLFAMIVYGVLALFLRAGIDWVTGLVEHRRRRVAEQDLVLDHMDARLAAHTTGRAEPQPRAPLRQEPYRDDPVGGSSSDSAFGQPRDW